MTDPTAQPVRSSSGVRTIAIAVLVALPVGALAGGLGGYIFGRKVVVQQSDGSTAPVSQAVRIDESSATIDAVDKVSPAVVSVFGSPKKGQVDSLPLGFGDVTGGGGARAGTGFILTSDGLIATNHHVVDDTSLAYNVVLADGRSFDVDNIEIDPSFDFAILHIKASNLPVVSLGSSDDLKVGQRVIAIGNAFGELQNTVTEGVVSARGRTITASSGLGGQAEQLEGLLQTDAAINEGNSGGPLVNLSGQVVGVNTATDTAGQNLGFAIPIDEAKVAIDSVVKSGKIQRPILGVRYVNLTKELAKLNDLPIDHGAYVGADIKQSAVLKNSPAAKLGIKKGDIVLKINEDEVQPDRSLAAILRKYHPGDEVTVTWMSSSKEQSGKVKLDTYGQ